MTKKSYLSCYMSVTVTQQKDIDEVFQPHKEDKRMTEDTVEELEPEQDDEVLTYYPLSDKSIHEPFPPTQEEENEVTHFPFQDHDNALFYDLDKEEEMESSNKEDLPCLWHSYDIDSDIVMLWYR